MTTVQGPARDLCTAVKFTALQHIRLRVVGGVLHSLLRFSRHYI